MSDFEDELAKRLADEQAASGGDETAASGQDGETTASGQDGETAASGQDDETTGADEPTAADLLGIESESEGDESGDIEIDLGEDDAPQPAADVAIDLSFEEEPREEPAEVDLDFADEHTEEDAPAEGGAADEDEDDSADEAVQKALEELRGELRAKPGDWYVIHTYSGMEKRVKQNLESRVTSLNMEDYIFEVRVPTEEVTEIRNGNKKTVTRTVLPGYVLVCMDLTDESWSTVRHTPSVTGFVGHATTPVPLGLDEVEKMLAPAVVAQASAASQGQSKLARKKKIEVADFKVGDSVMVTDGPFSGVHASITEINVNSQRLKALVEILGRETPVDLTFSQIQKV